MGFEYIAIQIYKISNAKRISYLHIKTFDIKILLQKDGIYTKFFPRKLILYYQRARSWIL